MYLGFPEYRECSGYLGDHYKLRSFLKLVKKYIFYIIKVDGIQIGRWGIREEGKIGALVFRDLLAAHQGLDRRYAMFPYKYVNL